MVETQDRVLIYFRRRQIRPGWRYNEVLLKYDSWIIHALHGLCLAFCRLFILLDAGSNKRSDFPPGVCLTIWGILANKLQHFRHLRGAAKHYTLRRMDWL